jgi:hypothetical protein
MNAQTRKDVLTDIGLGNPRRAQRRPDQDRDAQPHRNGSPIMPRNLKKRISLGSVALASAVSIGVLSAGSALAVPGESPY